MTKVTKPLNILMTPIGSNGDVNPFVGIGQLLHDRGHQVTIITAEPFRALVEGSGLTFVCSQTADQFDQLTQQQDLWHPRRGIGLVLRATIGAMPRLYDIIASLYKPKRTVLVGHILSFATRLFEETHRVPAVTLNLTPSAFRTLHQIAAPLPGVDLSGLPRWFKRMLWWLIDKAMFDRHIQKHLNRCRQDVRLPPIQRAFRGWVHSPQRVIGLFPKWFGPPQPDWPATLRLTGFPLFDHVSGAFSEPQMERFLDQDRPPIAITPGSANQHASRFFQTAIQAATRLDRRSLLLTRYPHQLPPSRPDDVLHVPYAPLSQVLPRCAAVIHHGGIGTCAAGLAAGVPQLVMPLGFDQPDNATQLRRLGVGSWVTPRRFRPKIATEALRQLLHQPMIGATCRRWADQIHCEPTNQQTCDLIEQIIESPLASN